MERGEDPNIHILTWWLELGFYSFCILADLYFPGLRSPNTGLLSDQAFLICNFSVHRLIKRLWTDPPTSFFSLYSFRPNSIQTHMREVQGIHLRKCNSRFQGLGLMVRKYRRIWVFCWIHNNHDLKTWITQAHQSAIRNHKIQRKSPNVCDSHTLGDFLQRPEVITQKTPFCKNKLKQFTK